MQRMHHSGCTDFDAGHVVEARNADNELPGDQAADVHPGISAGMRQPRYWNPMRQGTVPFDGMENLRKRVRRVRRYESQWLPRGRLCRTVMRLAVWLVIERWHQAIRAKRKFNGNSRPVRILNASME